MHRHLTAIIWDFDNTLVDTRRRNLNVTRQIVARVSGRAATEFPALRSVETYDSALHRTHNWQELYRHELGLDAQTTERAGRLWTEYQLHDETPVDFYDGLEQVLGALAHLPHGVVSLNSRDNILDLLGSVGLADAFLHVVGYEEVPYHRQKPAPDGLLLCVERLTGFAPGRVLYVGDHRTDALCAQAANGQLAERGMAVQVTAVFAAYGSALGADGWEVPPDFHADSPHEVLRVVERLSDG